jgi:hypothetical protein
MTNITRAAKKVAAATTGSVSEYRYASWYGVALAVLKLGYSTEQAEDILFSKLPRWAADNITDTHVGKPTGRQFARWLTTHPARVAELFFEIGKNVGILHGDI